jgi:hypothetical protein
MYRPALLLNCNAEPSAWMLLAGFRVYVSRKVRIVVGSDIEATFERFALLPELKEVVLCLIKVLVGQRQIG